MLARILTTGLAVLFLFPALLRADNDPKGDKELEGDWHPVLALKDGKELPQPADSPDVVSIRGDSLTFKVGDRTLKETVKVDATTTPKTIDVAPDGSPDKVRLGIYEIKGDELRICFAEPGKDRPTDLASKEGSGWMLATYKRVKK